MSKATIKIYTGVSYTPSEQQAKQEAQETGEVISLRSEELDSAFVLGEILAATNRPEPVCVHLRGVWEITDINWGVIGRITSDSEITVSRKNMDPTCGVLNLPVVIHTLDSPERVFAHVRSLSPELRDQIELRVRL